MLFIPGGVENQHPDKIESLSGAQGTPSKTSNISAVLERSGKPRPTSLGSVAHKQLTIVLPFGLIMVFFFQVNGFSKLGTNPDSQAKSPSSGYHPPLPPKPRQLLKSRENSSAQTPAAVAEISADEADLIRELLYVFQVSSVKILSLYAWLESRRLNITFTLLSRVLKVSFFDETIKLVTIL